MLLILKPSIEDNYKKNMYVVFFQKPTFAALRGFYSAETRAKTVTHLSSKRFMLHHIKSQ